MKNLNEPLRRLLEDLETNAETYSENRKIIKVTTRSKITTALACISHVKRERRLLAIKELETYGYIQKVSRGRGNDRYVLMYNLI